VALAERRRIESQIVQRGGEWQELPGTRSEVQRVADLFTNSDAPTNVLLDSEASEQRLDDLARSGDLGKYRHILLATHGIAEPSAHLRSRIILAQDRLPDPERQLSAGLPVFDGELSAAKILRSWKLNADLVTLSACETALGPYMPGEGHVGFAQTLLLSGARSVVLSLWMVDDAATALLMERFYQNLLGKREGLKQAMPKAEALAEAKQWLRTRTRKEVLERLAALHEGVSRGKNRPALQRLEAPAKTKEDDTDKPFAHPYYWAAFVLFGAPD
jgi:CHAT domain-containing protein